MALDDLHIRAASWLPASFDAATGEIEGVASTFAPVNRGSYLERLDPAAIDPATLIGAPVLDQHRRGSARDVIGIVTASRVDGQGLIVRIKRTAAPDADPIWQRIGDGTIRGLSIGYSIQK